MIASTKSAKRHPSQLNFELNLRTYMKKGTFKAPEPFFYPQAKEAYDAVGLDKTTFKYTH